MSINELKSLIHDLVDKSDNKYLLEVVHNLFSFPNNESGGLLWQNFTDHQRELILKAFEHSESEEYLLDHSLVMTRIKNEI